MPFPSRGRRLAFANFARIGRCSAHATHGPVDWANYQQTDAWQALMPDLNKYVTHIEVRVWGPSTVMPESLRPGA